VGEYTHPTELGDVQFSQAIAFAFGCRLVGKREVAGEDGTLDPDEDVAHRGGS